MVIKNGLVFTEENTFLPLSVLTQGDNITSLVSDDTALPASEMTSLSLTLRDVMSFRGLRTFISTDATDMIFVTTAWRR